MSSSVIISLLEGIWRKTDSPNIQGSMGYSLELKGNWSSNSAFYTTAYQTATVAFQTKFHNTSRMVRWLQREKESIQRCRTIPSNPNGSAPFPTTTRHIHTERNTTCQLKKRVLNSSDGAKQKIKKCVILTISAVTSSPTELSQMRTDLVPSIKMFFCKHYI